LELSTLKKPEKNAENSFSKKKFAFAESQTELSPKKNWGRSSRDVSIGKDEATGGMANDHPESASGRRGGFEELILGKKGEK